MTYQKYRRSIYITQRISREREDVKGHIIFYDQKCYIFRSEKRILLSFRNGPTRGSYYHYINRKSGEISYSYESIDIEGINYKSFLMHTMEDYLIRGRNCAGDELIQPTFHSWNRYKPKCILIKYVLPSLIQLCKEKICQLVERSYYDVNILCSLPGGLGQDILLRLSMRGTVSKKQLRYLPNSYSKVNVFKNHVDRYPEEPVREYLVKNNLKWIVDTVDEFIEIKNKEKKWNGVLDRMVYLGDYKLPTNRYKRKRIQLINNSVKEPRKKKRKRKKE